MRRSCSKLKILRDKGRGALTAPEIQSIQKSCDRPWIYIVQDIQPGIMVPGLLVELIPVRAE